MKLEPRQVLYGEAPFKGYQDTTDNTYYFADRIKNRGVLDFGVLSGGTRKGLSLAANDINTPILVKSLHCVSGTNTDDSLTLEVWQGTDMNKVANRVVLQYYHKTEMPKAYPELILFPDMTLFATPSADCRVLIYCEPVNISFYGGTLIS